MDATDRQSVLLRHRLEYAGVVAVERLFRALPYGLCLRLASALARFAFHVVRWRRREALRRIHQVFPGIGGAEARRIAFRSLETILLNAAELMPLRGVDDAWIAAHIENTAEAMRKLRTATAAGGAILALPHFGNWDLAGIIVAHNGIPIFSIAGVQHNPLTNDWINRKRATGIAILNRGSAALRQIVKRLKGRELFAILPDVRMKTPDLEVPFLGATANVGRGMATFARKTGSPILVANVRRLSRSRHFLDVGDPLAPDPALDEESDIARLTAAVMAAVESQIRSDPGQWFWYNRRWVLEPVSV
jgi:KDO2-lipid IV(A) lauroyltransferase